MPMIGVSHGEWRSGISTTPEPEPGGEWPYTPVALVWSVLGTAYAIDSDGIWHTNPPISIGTEELPAADAYGRGYLREWVGNTVRGVFTGATVGTGVPKHSFIWSTDNANTFNQELRHIVGTQNANVNQWKLTHDHQFLAVISSGPYVGVYTAGDDREFTLYPGSNSNGGVLSADLANGNLWRLVGNNSLGIQLYRAGVDVAVPFGSQNGTMMCRAMLDGDHLVFQTDTPDCWRASFAGDNWAALPDMWNFGYRLAFTRPDGFLVRDVLGYVWAGTPDGLTWSGWIESSVGVYTSDISPGGPHIWWACRPGDASNNRNGVWKSTDDGVTWTFVASNLAAPGPAGDGTYGFKYILAREPS